MINVSYWSYNSIEIGASWLIFVEGMNGTEVYLRRSKIGLSIKHSSDAYMIMLVERLLNPLICMLCVWLLFRLRNVSIYLTTKTSKVYIKFREEKFGKDYHSQRSSLIIWLVLWMLERIMFLFQYRFWETETHNNLNIIKLVPK